MFETDLDDRETRIRELEDILDPEVILVDHDEDVQKKEEVDPLEIVEANL